MGFPFWAALSHLRFLFFAGLTLAPILAPRLKLFSPYQRESCNKVASRPREYVMQKRRANDVESKIGRQTAMEHW